MGRKTWVSLPPRFRPLPGRLNLVLSRQPEFEAKGAVVCEDWAEALAIAREQAAEDGQDEICVIGGADLFALALPRAARIYLTEVDGEPDGDVVMPAIDETGWREVEPRSRPRRPGRRLPDGVPGAGARLSAFPRANLDGGGSSGQWSRQ